MSDQSKTAEEPDIRIGSREQLLYLLAEAAEIEHTLMCSYLFAAFSLKRAGESGLSTMEGEAVERWRRTIMGVAIEEMGHLLIVANLTVAVGGRPHFTRPNFPVAPGYFPSGVVVNLRRFRPETLDHFIFLERPQGLSGDDGEGFDHKPYTREQARPGLMPSAQDYQTIGHLYEAIRANFIALCGSIGPAKLFVGGADAQMGPGDISLKGVAAIVDLDAVRAAIDVIVEQGEGSPADQEESHYRSFLSIRDELAELSGANPAFAPAWPVADNPVLRRPIDVKDETSVEAPLAAARLDFACATYGLLLRLLIQCFGRREPGGHSRKKLVGAAIDLMRVLGVVADELARLPATGSSRDLHAGMSFTMLRGVEPLLSGDVEKQLLHERLTELARGARALKPQNAALAQKLDALADAFA